MEFILGFSFFLGVVWSAAKSFLGIVGLFGVTEFDPSDFKKLAIYMTAFTGSIIVLSMSLSSVLIWEDPPKKDIYPWLRLPYIGAIAFDAYTSYLGTAQNIIIRDSSSLFLVTSLSDVWKNTSTEQQLILFFLTFLVTVSPIVFTKLLPN